MRNQPQIDCVVVGYNEIPFEKYVQLLGNCGRDSEAYRDLKFSFVDVNGRPMNYVGLLNHMLKIAAPEVCGEKILSSRGDSQLGGSLPEQFSSQAFTCN